jgi:putative membrane protein
MTALLWVSGISAGILHVLFFLQESVWWMRPAIHQRVFGLSLEQARTTRLLAFNQGFYNLFLAAGILLGLGLLATGHATAGQTLVAFCSVAMLGAALVLLGSKPALWLGALIQGLPPALALVALAATARGG